MKILVIEDNKLHQAAAKAQLQDHDTTVVDTYDKGLDLVRDTHDFEVVLVDLMMPASNRSMGREGDKFVGQEMPVGVFLALLAAKNGAKYVSLITDTNHHDHPASACIDPFNRRQDMFAPAKFTVGGASVVFCNDVSVARFQEKDLATEIRLNDLSEGYVLVKRWRCLLDYSLGLKMTMRGSE